MSTSEATVADLLRHERAVKTGLNGMLAKRLMDSNANVYHGTAAFAGEDTVDVELDSRDLLLPFLDGEMSRALTSSMERGGVTFHWNERAERCVGRGTESIELTLTSGATLVVDALLVAAGRRSNTTRLNLSAAGLSSNERGLIHVDAQYRTEVPHINAAGDVIGFPPLASTSMQQARIAMRHAFDQRIPSDALRVLPAGIYTIPEVGMVGETEESLLRKGVDYVAGRGPCHSIARGRIIGDTAGLLKLLFRRGDMKLVGVHPVGEQATEFVHVGMMAMLTGSTAEIFDAAYFNMPTLGELYKLAFLNATAQVNIGRTLFPPDATFVTPELQVS